MKSNAKQIATYLVGWALAIMALVPLLGTSGCSQLPTRDKSNKPDQPAQQFIPRDYPPGVHSNWGDIQNATAHQDKTGITQARVSKKQVVQQPDGHYEAIEVLTAEIHDGKETRDTALDYTGPDGSHLSFGRAEGTVDASRALGISGDIVKQTDLLQGTVQKAIENSVDRQKALNEGKPLSYISEGLQKKSKVIDGVTFVPLGDAAPEPAE